MPADETPRLWFELDTERDPIGGRMHVGAHPPRTFDSWLELVALIEQTRAETRLGRTSGPKTGHE